ncbi:hypothetical protein LX32DRAFT_5631 [Colletotrichum zoysiae]|uniref:Uncharacterized protein n=1 Tax=Colletotrichum zoysiae TaxID=1216348 RepID=A0AAD9HTJ4_9PEZI|nr:hypothetical protein LX32DRAFT_5631 [Colletotrichum zoysiae]
MPLYLYERLYVRTLTPALLAPQHPKMSGRPPLPASRLCLVTEMRCALEVSGRKTWSRCLSLADNQSQRVNYCPGKTEALLGLEMRVNREPRQKREDRRRPPIGPPGAFGSNLVHYLVRFTCLLPRRKKGRGERGRGGAMLVVFLYLMNRDTLPSLMRHTSDFFDGTAAAQRIIHHIANVYGNNARPDSLAYAVLRFGSSDSSDYSNPPPRQPRQPRTVASVEPGEELGTSPPT